MVRKPRRTFYISYRSRLAQKVVTLVVVELHGQYGDGERRFRTESGMLLKLDGDGKFVYYIAPTAPEGYHESLTGVLVSLERRNTNHTVWRK